MIFVDSIDSIVVLLYCCIVDSIDSIVDSVDSIYSEELIAT